MAVKKKFYAIAAGRKPGIYTNWPEAQAQVMTFAGARYKGFATRAEAEAWIKNPVYPAPTSKTKSRKGAPATAKTSKEGEIIIYTDGGARFNPGPGGFGVVMLEAGNRQEFSGGYRLTTNNRMELMGCIVALRQLNQTNKTVTLYSDSKYVVNGITKDWARNWRKNNWIKSDKQPAVNPDLWAQLLDLTEKLNIDFRWVKGHAGNEFNERCDELAVSSAAQDNLQKDNGYKG
ncbi:MAG: ribonuclease HI [Desulfobulbaceae bacterium]|uniref:Ribonuclease H n=1 Tax=Candidatus Desulfobia pelagia TaxID=2841692 RepID=A0A8J6NDB2_9BACT|nr:ribonuclease HI [Candidatus Desulfobia pelagia]